MFIPREALAVGHLGTVIWKRGEKRKRRHIMVSAAWEAAITDFSAWDGPLYIEGEDV